MKKLFQILAIAAVLALATSSCAILCDEPEVVVRTYPAPYVYPDGVYVTPYWYTAPRPPHYIPMPYHRPPHNPSHQPGYNKPLPPRPEVHRPSPRPQRPSAPSVPAPPRQPANTPPVNYHKAPR